MQLFLHRAFVHAFQLTCILDVFMLVGVVVAIVSEDEEIATGLMLAFVHCSLLTILCHRLRWFFSFEGRRARMVKKFVEYEEKIKQRERRKRDRMSRRSTVKNIREFVRSTSKELKYRENNITSNVFFQVQLTLKNAKRELDFSRVRDIYSVVTTVNVSNLNDELRKRTVPNAE
jgi:hypothetical protein